MPGDGGGHRPGQPGGGSQQRFATKAEARAAVAAWIDEYNRQRKHSSNGMRSPINYELTAHQQRGAA